MSGADDGGIRRVDADGDDDPRLAQFLRGVTMGALVGAAIAGSAIWRRRLARSAELAAGPSRQVPDAPPGPPTPPTLAATRTPERPAPD